MDEEQSARLASVFGNGGLLETQGLQRRESQVRLARGVAKAIAAAEDGKQAVVMGEGPCGTGKSLAYLVPAIETAERTGGKVIVATANIALQEQLVDKDLPWLQKVLGWPFKFVLVKGKSNYLCLDRFTKYVGESVQTSWTETADDGEIRGKLMAWSEKTETGDKSELDFNPKGTWGKVSVTGSECHGSACKKYEECWAMKARKGLDKADVVVVNYHLLLASWVIEAEFLPAPTVLVCDEAHALPDIARSFETEEFFDGTVRWLSGRVKASIPSALLTEYEAASQELLDQVGQKLDKPWSRVRLQEGTFYVDGVVKALTKIAKHLEDASDYQVDQEQRAKLKRASSLAEDQRDGLLQIAEGTTDQFVCWVENHSLAAANKQVRPVIKSSPIDVSKYLKENLYQEGRATIMVSATMTTAGTFEHIGKQIGAPANSLALKLDSPFDLANQGILFVPDRGERNGDEGDQETALLVAKVVDLVPGGVLGLFTSYKAMELVAQSIAPKLAMQGRTLLKQGDLPRSRLLDQFRADVSSVLLGTRSFFEGVDVPGDALQCVIIDRLPFPVPDDPVVAAIQEMYEAKGKNGWFSYSLPVSCLTVAQAAGRLIRTTTDRGAVVLLDRRVLTKGYGKTVRESMPPFKLVRGWDEFATFMAKK